MKMLILKFSEDSKHQVVILIMLIFFIKTHFGNGDRCYIAILGVNICIVRSPSSIVKLIIQLKDIAFHKKKIRHMNQQGSTGLFV